MQDGAQVERHIGVAGMECRKRGHDAVLHEERRAPYDQVALRALPRLSQAFLRRLQLRQQRGTGFGVLRTIRGELEATTAALEQLETKFSLKGAHQLGDGLQRHAPLARRCRQTAGLRSRKEVLNGFEFVHLAMGVGNTLVRAIRADPTLPVWSRP